MFWECKTMIRNNRRKLGLKLEISVVGRALKDEGQRRKEQEKGTGKRK